MKPEPKKIDVINRLLEDCIIAYPVSSFVIGIYQQYQRRGWLTRKQLEGLLQRAKGIEGLAPEKTAALEAIIRKMPVRQKSALPESTPLYRKDEELGRVINEILSKYPQHKRVLFLHSKYQNNEPLSAAEASELLRFKTILKV
ncbi:MAG TPA: hypothetical protein VF145_14190 [Chitinophagaceae bacterium]